MFSLANVQVENVVRWEITCLSFASTTNGLSYGSATFPGRHGITDASGQQYFCNTA